MLNVPQKTVILAIQESARARYLYEAGTLASEILRHAAQVLKEVSNNGMPTVVTDSDQILVRAASLDMEVIRVDGNDVDGIRAHTGEALVLSPHRGPISIQRVMRVLESWQRNTCQCVSAMRLAANCNPAWLSAVPEKNMQKGSAVIPDFKAPLKLELSKDIQERLGVDGKKVLGSQWLPEIDYLDGAIEITSGQSAGFPLSIHVDPSSCTDMALFYRLPLYQLSDKETPDLPLDRIRIPALFYTMRSQRAA